MKNIIPETCKIIEAISPSTNGSGLSGDFINLKNCGLAYVIVHINQGHADPVALSIEQAENVGGTGATPITNDVPIWSNLDCAASDALVQRDADVDYTTDAALKHKIICFQIDPALLAPGFTSIRLVAGASDAGNVVAAMYILTDLRNQSRADDLPSAIVD